MVSSARRRRVRAAAVLLCLTVAGCSATSAPEPPPAVTTLDPPTATRTPEAAASSSIEPDLEAMAIPPCETLLPIEKVRSTFADDAEYFESDSGVPLSERMPSPEANAAMAQATHELDCLWGLPGSDVGFTIDVAIVPTGALEELVPTLHAGGFTEAPLGGGRSFTHALDDDSGLWVTVYAFDGNAWVTYIGMGLAATAAGLTAEVLANLQAANPGL
ncbi:MULTISPECIES: hypothetical protein [unclassified Pseudactinotalea]|uniref:hypothetical protein n=1 Tax=unclassified Pseudactinotalea TaxID=2649176 RepID=UPI00128D9ACA|nr:MULTISPECIES: hypothetical protein [unclassified Pseudactinotalea]MPV48831.1 hypothetical protein [Pseudactinotalea sp. HY160]QGH68810.1 hypothetical protein GCE65_04335 [Pseudactinotalea sp. HY158]